MGDVARCCRRAREGSTENNQDTGSDAPAVLEKLGPDGGTHGEWSEAYKRATGAPNETFNRRLKILKGRNAVRQDRKRYYLSAPTAGV